MPSTENYKTVTPTPTVDELEEGDLVTYAVRQFHDSRWYLHEGSEVRDADWWRNEFRKGHDFRILEVQREVKPKFEPGDLAIIKPKREHYPRFVAFRGRPGTGDDWNFALPYGDLDSLRDVAVESAIPAVAVPKAEWDALVSGIRKPGISLRAAALVEAWKEATGHE